jgi:hypothetical protein
MCDILKPPEQVPTSQTQSSGNELVSAGAEATASVAAILESRPYAESSQQASRGSAGDVS